jgi:anti-sigma B factor antagonist
VVELSLQVDVEPEGPDTAGWTVVRVGGELDNATGPRLRERLVAAIAERGANVVLDLSGVEFLDSTGLGVLVGVPKRARTLGGDLRLAAATPPVRRVFEITALDRTLPIADTVAEAIGEAPPP